MVSFTDALASLRAKGPCRAIRWASSGVSEGEGSISTLRRRLRQSPRPDRPAQHYIGCFENRHGEQWIFTFDRATRAVSLWGGDAGWASAHPVRDGGVDGLILAAEEASRSYPGRRAA